MKEQFSGNNFQEVNKTIHKIGKTFQDFLHNKHARRLTQFSAKKDSKNYRQKRLINLFRGFYSPQIVEKKLGCECLVRLTKNINAFNIFKVKSKSKNTFQLTTTKKMSN